MIKSIKSFVHKNDIPNDVIIQGDIAIDTEAMGLNIKRDRLCVIQIADSKGNCHLVQFPDNNYDAPNLKSLLSKQNTTKIFHFARFDVAIIKYYLKINIEQIYCTKIASYIGRTYSRFHGLKELCYDLLGVRINKQQQSSNWNANNLTDEQILYAASDVAYLHQLQGTLDYMLANLNRYELAQQCFKCIPTIVALDLHGWNGGEIFAHDYRLD